jgi:hypothetical protein
VVLCVSCKRLTSQTARASGALTVVVSAEVERLRTQHADAVREKSAADSKCRKLADKVAALEGEKTDLRRQLAEERKEANEALAKAQAAQAEANLARMEGGLARERAEQLEERLRALQSRVERAEAATRTEAERTHKQLMDSYHELGARTAEFEVPDREPGLRCLEWVQEELQALPTIVEGFMSYASLVTCEGAMNALSREGCRHYEVFDQGDEDFERDIYKVEDSIVKESAGALYDRMWGPHGREVVRERAETARGQVMFDFCLVFVGCGLCMGLLNLCAVSHAARGERVDDFGALNSVLPDPESNPAEAVLEPLPETAGGAPDAPAAAAAGGGPPPETAEGVPDAPAAAAAGEGPPPTAAPRAEDPVTVAESTAEAPATAGSSQVA